MNNSLLQNHTFSILLLILFLFSCKQPETVVVREGPKTTADTTKVQKDTVENAEFKQLIIGEFNNIFTLDPLFAADNASTMRAVQLLYEGLVRFNEQGNITPAVAKSWQVSDDSLSYRFTLRSDIYYHDSDIFSAGVGRKLRAGDVKFVFERMARNSVPPDAAQLFMTISGFEPYYQEQRNLYNPANRRLKEISGIQVPNDTTVVFKLDEKDSAFLQKLATPFALIYPREAVGNTVAGFRPVGSGPFRFSQKTENGTYIFSRFNNYYSSSRIRLNRVDIRTISKESELFKAFANGSVQIIPQLGPQTIGTVISNEGGLVSSYANRFELEKYEGMTRYTLRFNPKADLPETMAKSIAATFYADSARFFKQIPASMIQRHSSAEDVSVSPLPEYDRPIYSMYSDDPFIRLFYNDLLRRISANGLDLKMRDILTPTQNTSLLMTVSYPLVVSKRWSKYPELVSFSIQHLSLRKPGITNFSFNRYPWWINLRDTDLSEKVTRK